MPTLADCERVLVVEDEYLIAFDVADTLQSLGAKSIEIVAEASAGLEQLEKGGVDLVVLDIELRDGICFELAQVLARRGIPMIYVTGFSREDYPELPEAPWVTKPARREDLLPAIAALR